PRRGSREARDSLQEIGKQKSEAAECGIEQERCGIGGRKVSVAKERQIDQRMGGMALPPDKSAKTHNPRHNCCDGRCRPAICRTLDEPEGYAAKKEKGQDCAGPVDAYATSCRRLVQRSIADHHRNEDKRHIEKEDRAP